MRRRIACFASPFCARCTPLPNAPLEEGCGLHTQRSFDSEAGGCLYVVGTPIGNLQDASSRSLQVLSEVDWIACEDTRHTRKLLSHFGISTPFTSYHQHNQREKGAQLIQWMKQGRRVALVSDAGMPVISDPGEELVRLAVAENIPVIPVPGPNAAVTALVVSGLPARTFLFLGFLPREQKALARELERIKHYPETLILYEAPHRLYKTLQALHRHLGNRRVCLTRELTKKHEEVVRGRLDELLEWFQEQEVRGECTLVVEGARTDSATEEQPYWEQWDVTEHVQYWMEQGLSVKEAMKKTAQERGVPKREVYRMYHGLQ